MNKEWIKINILFILISLLGFVIFVLTLYDIFLNKDLTLLLIASYIILFLISFMFIFYYIGKRVTSVLSIEEFEKTLKGGLFHFKCQVCDGVFAIKKSRGNDKKKLRMECPDCGAVGIIPKNPACIKEDIPEKKSTKAVFRCKTCGEGITIWAEGRDLYNEPQVLNCPFCGVKKPLNRIL